ncbi:hypothetical protein [Brevibacterium sp. VCM10]|uniref:hypothetical protein n=1 Tax=Brevibacterium sp. VCM10 TaxID=1381751 RepID=UPI0004B17445|nr:hypothetical protein [Brevibacterium sp. VCM10]
MGRSAPDVDIALYVDLYQQGRLILDDLVSERISLDDINEGYAQLREGAIARSVVVFD